MPLLAVFTGLVIGGVIIASPMMQRIAAWGNFFQDSGRGLQSLLGCRDSRPTARYSAARSASRPRSSPASRVISPPATPQLMLKAIYPIHGEPGRLPPRIFLRAGGGARFPLRACSISARKASSSWARSARPLSATASSACPGSSTCRWPLLGGALAGAIWGAIPGYLKAKFGAHEVVNTIMMN